MVRILLESTFLSAPVGRLRDKGHGLDAPGSWLDCVVLGGEQDGGDAARGGGAAISGALGQALERKDQVMNSQGKS